MESFLDVIWGLVDSNSCISTGLSNRQKIYRRKIQEWEVRVVMSDLCKLKEILDNQAKRGIKSGDWPKLEYEEERIMDSICIKIEVEKIGFCFTKNGRLIGIYNSKE